MNSTMVHVVPYFVPAGGQCGYRSAGGPACVQLLDNLFASLRAVPAGDPKREAVALALDRDLDEQRGAAPNGAGDVERAADRLDAVAEPG